MGDYAQYLRSEQILLTLLVSPLRATPPRPFAPSNGLKSAPLPALWGTVGLTLALFLSQVGFCPIYGADIR